MQFLDFVNGNEWLEKKCRLAPKSIYELCKNHEFKYHSAYAIPKESARKTFFASLICSYVNFKEMGCLWIFDRCIDDLTQNYDLFDGYLKSMGQDEGLNKKPCHIFSENDALHIECLISLALYLLFDVMLIDDVSNVITVFDMGHDEWIDIYSTDGDKFKEINNNFVNFGFKVLNS